MPFRPEAIRQLRNGLEETQATFARRLSVPQSTVSLWECGRRAPTAKEHEMLEALWIFHRREPVETALVEPGVVERSSRPPAAAPGRAPSLARPATPRERSAKTLSPKTQSRTDPPRSGGKPSFAPSMDIDKLVEGSTRDGRRAFRHAADDDERFAYGDLDRDDDSHADDDE